MRSLFILISFHSVLLLQTNAFGAITLNSVTGASNTVRETDGTWTIYGGIQKNSTFGEFADCNDSQTCDTCQGGGNDAGGGVFESYACNMTGVFKETKMTFDVSIPSGATGKFLLCNGSQEVDNSTNLQTALQTTWSEICGRVTSGSSDSTCVTPISVTYQLGIGTGCDAMGENKVNVKFVTRAVDPKAVSTYTPSPFTTPPVPDDCSTSSGYGACFFKIFPGDDKVYLDDVGIGAASSFPSTEATSVRYTNLVFFHTQVDTADIDATTDDPAAYFNLNTSASVGYIPIGESGDLSGSFIDGLSNDIRYCFKMGSQDIAGNIDNISSADCSTGNTANCANVCMAPSEVLGLLSDKKCFIATAAFGSPLDAHVNLLREFRNKFLVKNWPGRKLVKFYYKVSPPLAQWISKNETARAVVRGVLWPVLGWASLALTLGWFGLFLPFLLLGAVILLLRKRRLFWGF